MHKYSVEVCQVCANYSSVTANILCMHVVALTPVHQTRQGMLDYGGSCLCMTFAYHKMI